jgi:multidrug transporter EmrE-like cation transporter
MKKERERLVDFIVKYTFVLFVSAVGVTGQLLLRKGLSKYNDIQFEGFITKLISIVFQPVVILALFCYGFGLIAYLFLLSKLEITSVYPITTSLTFGGITMFGYFLLGESLTWPKIVGIVLIVTGIILIDRFG